jgi:hypothetical protein
VTANNPCRSLTTALLPLALVVTLAACSPSSTSTESPGTSTSVAADLTGGEQASVSSPTEPTPTTTAEDWTAVGQVFGRQGEFKDGLYSLTFPRSDLMVGVGEVTLQPALSTTTAVTFYGTPDQAGVMADLVLTEDERQAVLSELAAGGINITAVHEHLPAHSPTVWWHHIEAMGDAAKIAATLKDALAASGTPLPSSSPPTSPETSLEGLDPAALDESMGRSGTAAGGVYKYAIPRKETITMDSMTVPPSQAQTVVGFQPVGGGRAAVNGDIVMTAEEVQPVLTALRDGGLDVVALHNHMLNETPRLFYVHFWAVDDATSLATALRSTIDQTNAEGGS